MLKAGLSISAIRGTPLPNERRISGRVTEMDIKKPVTRPQKACFSSGPCAKNPTFELNKLAGAPLGRSHRAAVGKTKLKLAIEETRKILEIPSDYSDSPYIISKKLINSGKKNLLLNSKIKIKCPVHLVHGGQDADVPIETSLKIMEQIESDDVKLTIVKSANHQFSEQKNLKLIFNSINEMIN